MFMISHFYTCIANDLLICGSKKNSKYILDYILIAPLIKVFRIKIAISLNVSWNKNLHDDPLFLSHFWLIYIHIFHFGKYQELFNSRSKMAHLPLSEKNGYKSVKTALLLSNVIDADHQNSCLFTNKGHFSSPLCYFIGVLAKFHE